MPEFASRIHLSSLNGKNGFRLDGVSAFDLTGYSVASAGDVNGDGFDDVIVGGSLADRNGYNSGASYVVFGQASGFASSLQLSDLNGANGFRSDGAAAGDYSGHSVASAGDVNGDGFSDVIVGAFGADRNGGRSGSSYVVFGNAGGFNSSFQLSSLDGMNGFRIDGVATFDYSGHSVSSAGDVNGDGFGDLIVGAPSADPNGLSSGASYVVFGRSSGFPSSLQLSGLDDKSGFRIAGVAAYDGSGWSVASAGDVNGDGFADLIIGAPWADPNGAYSGSSYVVFGRASGSAPNFHRSSIDGVNGFRIDGVAGRDNSGRTVASAGDVNGDGFADLIIGALGAQPNGLDAGASYVVFGRAAGFPSSLQLSNLDGKNGFRIDGSEYDYSSRSVASAGDVNGDGFDDVIVSARNTDAGIAYVVFGKASGFAATVQVSNLDGANGFRIAVDRSFETAGICVASAGDINNDGFADLIVGAPGDSPNHLVTGASYVIFGHRADEAVSRVGTNIANTINGGKGEDTIRGLGGNDRLIAWQGNDTVLGEAGHDRLFGGDGDDVLSGGRHNDALSGGRGADTLFGDVGNDVLSGNAGNDRLNGGLGNDIFYFSGGGGSDVIGDFEDNLDTIRLGGTLGVATVNQALARALQIGNDVVFIFDNGEILRVLNTTKAALADDLQIV